jgi:hypothetical protein
MPRRRVVVLAVAAVLAAGVLGSGWWLVRRDSRVDPSTVALPSPSGEPTEVRAYFAGDGAPLVAFLEATSDLPATSTPEQCQALAAELTGIGEPPDLMGLAVWVPDPGVRDVAVQHTTAVGRYLDECGAGRPLESAADRAHFSATVLRRLLERDGVL